MMLQIYLMRFCIISDDVDSEVAHPEEVIAETCGLLDKPHMVGRHPLTLWTIVTHDCNLNN